MLKQIQKLLATLLIFLTAINSLPTVFADSTFEPYQQTFIISAYYSPLPDQSVYFRGSYEADRRLNGNGTNGADGTQVYPGMLAAPKSYAFGMKLAIPGLGIGAIHDRGGAIVKAGVRSNTHDRIDVWMGRGEEGLARALQWGMRTVTATVYPSNYQIAESFNLPGFAPQFVVDLRLGDTSEEVRRLQTELKTYGYYRGEIAGNFDEETKQALLGYQLVRKILANTNEAGAGYLGPKTREVLNREIFKRTWRVPKSLLASSTLQTGGGSSNPDSRFPVTLSRGDRGERVRELQIALTKIGVYECEINGVYDENTENCLFKFQQDQGILASRDEFGAGYFGAQTRTALTASLIKQETKLNKLIAGNLPSNTAAPGEKNENVKNLQAGLKKLGHFSDEVTGSYDQATISAVANFQIAENILESQTAYGAGWFGAKTKSVFDARLREQLLALPNLPENPDWNRKTAVAYTPQFDVNLALGDSGERVRELQETLQQLDYFSEEVTGNYGRQTATAVLKFQLEHAVVSASSDLGAGVLGPKTRTALNAVTSRKKVALMKITAES